jgi:SAM-dependent methyltransferase
VLDVRELHQGNRDAWNRTARAGYCLESERHIELLRQGGSGLMAAERRILGDLSGWCERAIHLQCSHGFDGLSLLNAGARELVGVDISEEMLASAKEKSDALGAHATWICSDILDTPEELNGTADLVYTGKGAICWMIDLDAWAAIVVRLLKPGGKFLLYEGHPLDFLWDESAATYVLREGASYFQGEPTPERGFPFAAAGRVDSSRPVNLTSRVWTVGETVTALVNAGLIISLLEEVAEPFWDQFKHIPPAELHKLPHCYAILALKP